MKDRFLGLLTDPVMEQKACPELVTLVRSVKTEKESMLDRVQMDLVFVVVVSTCFVYLNFFVTRFTPTRQKSP